MGTNFYVKGEKCKCCGHGPVDIHLGKSSWPWKFLFKWNPTLYTSWDHMRIWLLDKDIVDEYGTKKSYGEFIELVERKQHSELSKSHATSFDDGDVKIIAGYEFYDREFS